MISDLFENHFLPLELSDWMTATLFPPHLLCSFTDKQFLLSQSAFASYSPPARDCARARAHTHTHKCAHLSHGSMGIDRVGKGALITGPRVQKKTAENRSLQLFRAAEQNRLPPVSTARAEPGRTDGASRQHRRPLLCQQFTSRASGFSQTHRPTIKTL